MQTWNIYLQSKRNKTVFFVSVFSLALILFSFLQFLTYAENRQGVIFHDPVLAMFKPLDISVYTFLVTYSIAIAGIVVALKKPEVFVLLLQAYAIMTLLRMLCLYLLPLEPPADIIPLYDVFLKFSFYSGRDNLKDLFFSGHTATIFLFAFAFKNKQQKRFFFVGGILVGAMVMLQHVHYSIDVIVAPFVSYMVIKFLKNRTERA